MVYDHTGITLAEFKRDMVYRRLVKRIRSLGLKDFKSYCDILAEGETTGNEDEFVVFRNAVTTNLTSFFRENHHFEYLSQTVLPSLVKKNASSRKIKIWSTASSTGEEPYSLAITALETLEQEIRQGWKVEIIATDIDTDSLKKGATGVYTMDRVEDLKPERLKKWFKRGTGKNAGMVKVSPKLQDIISFYELNLLKEWPINPHEVDIIFCRNVVIYFDHDTKQSLYDRFDEVLVNDGYLFIGHSESLFNMTTKFVSLGNTIYQKG